MWIVAGERSYGRVAEYNNEFVQTKFAHVWFLPFVPIKSQWAHRVGYGTLGFEIRTDARSVAATYLRWYAPWIAAAVMYRAPVVVGAPVGAALALAVAWSWSWRWLRGARARKRSDWDLLAFRTRCDPARMLPDPRAKLAQAFEDAWKLVGGHRSPEDVARFGAADARQAVCAYGLLRLAAVARGDRDALQLADRISDGTFEPTQDDGPYRTSIDVAPAPAPAPPPPAGPGDVASDDDGEWDTACGDRRCDGILGADERCTVCQLTYEEGEAVAARRDKAARDEAIAARRGAAVRAAKGLIQVGVIAGGVVLAVGLYVVVRPLLSPPTPISFDELASYAGYDSDVTVTCDRVTELGTVERTFRMARGSDGRETGAPVTLTYAVALCERGDQVLPVIRDLDAPAGELAQSGRVYAANQNSAQLYANLPSPPVPLPYYLAPDAPLLHKTLYIAAGIAAFLFALGLIGKGVRDLRRARRIVA